MIEKNLIAAKANGKAVREKLAAKLTTSASEGCYAMKWVDDNALTAMILGELIERFEASTPDVELWKKELRMMEKRWSPEYSTSTMSNFMRLAEFNAVRKFQEILERA